MNKKAVLRIFFKSSSATDLIQTEQEARDVLKNWSETIDNGCFTGRTQDGVEWIVRCDQIAAMLVLPYEQVEKMVAKGGMNMGRNPLNRSGI